LAPRDPDGGGAAAVVRLPAANDWRGTMNRGERRGERRQERGERSYMWRDELQDIK